MENLKYYNKIFLRFSNFYKLYKKIIKSFIRFVICRKKQIERIENGMGRLIFHVDVNSAFLSWEASRRVAKGEEDIRLIPSCISGDPSKRTSIVLAKSIPAKKFGIVTGESIATAMRKCPDLYIAGPDFRLYSECSMKFKDICRQYAPQVEEYSIDECFMDMSKTSLLYPNPIETAYEIKNLIRDTLGFTVNIGIGPNKLLAKMAGDFEKPDKVHTLFKEEIPKKMWPLPVGELISVGKNTADKLYRAQIRTIGELANADLKFIQSLIGNKLGAQIYEYANGIDDSEIESDKREAKGYSAAITFERDITSIDTANKVLMGLAESVAARLRKDEAKAYCVSVNIRFTDFKNKSHQKHLDEATDITLEIYNVARKLLEEFWDNSPIRLMGLALSNVTRDGCEQIELFGNEEKERQKKIDLTMDNIRNRFGIDKVVRGSLYGESMNINKKHKAQMEIDRENKKSE